MSTAPAVAVPGGSAARATALLERLIRAADDDGHLAEVLDAEPADVVAGLLVDELVFRADPPRNTEPVRVRVRVTRAGRARDHDLDVDAERGIVAAGPASGEPGLHVEYTAERLVRALFGTPVGPSNADRRTIPLFGRAVDATELPPRRALVEVPRAADALLAGVEPARCDLGELAVRYGSDKWGGLHWFARHYEHHFGPLRDRPLRVLEIGIGGYQDPDRGGGSLKMWKHYFRRGSVFGMDVFPKNGLDEPRITTLLGDQGDPDALQEVAARFGPFDIVIDDGSHKNEHVRTTFAALFPLVRHGGWYVVEDLWTAYIPAYGGTAGDQGGPGTSVGLLKELLDAMHHEEWTDAGPPADPDRSATLAGLHVYHNIAFLQKAMNVEGGIPAWVPRVPTW